jgi:hypothetical protein
VIGQTPAWELVSDLGETFRLPSQKSSPSSLLIFFRVTFLAPRGSLIVAVAPVILASSRVATPSDMVWVLLIPTARSTEVQPSIGRSTSLTSA